MLVAFAAITACTRSASPPSAPSPLLGSPLPRLETRTPITGPPFDHGVPSGKPVVVDFFAEYCEPCKRTLPAIERLAKERPDVTFIGISEDEYATTARALAERYGLTFTVVHDESGALRGRFRVSALPITFVADRAGIVRWVGSSTEKGADLGRVLDAL